MIAPTLHYIHDPLCGWCYAVAPMVEAVSKAGIRIKMHGGGLWEPASSLAPDKRAYIRRSDTRIAGLSGVTFGPAYLDGLLSAADTVFWSRPTIAAVLAARTMAEGADLRMMHAIQRAHYVEGRRVVEPAVLAEIASTIELAKGAFLDAMAAVEVDDHIDGTRRWMQELGLRGFPSFVLEQDGALVPVQHEPFYGRPDAFLHALMTITAAPAAA